MLSCHLSDHRGVLGSRYARVCSDLGLRERAAQAVVKLVQRGALGGSKRREGERTTGVECDTAGAACSAFESLWSEPFLPCSARSESWLLHTSTSASRRNDWYEATLLFEAVALQWFSLAFVQSLDTALRDGRPAPDVHATARGVRDAGYVGCGAGAHGNGELCGGRARA